VKCGEKSDDRYIEGDMGKEQEIQLKYNRNAVEIQLPEQRISTVFLGVSIVFQFNSAVS
jgi:hypothetical protein